MTEMPISPFCNCTAVKLNGEICNKRHLAIYGDKCPKHRNSKFVLCKGCGEHGTQSQYGYCSANQSCRYKCIYQSRKNNLNKRSEASIPLVHNEPELIIIESSPMILRIIGSFMKK